MTPLLHAVASHYNLIEGETSIKTTEITTKIFAAFFTSRIIGLLLIGTISDRLGKCRTLLAVLLVQGCFQLMYGIIDEFWWFVFVRSLVGSLTCITPLFRALVLIWTDTGSKLQKNLTFFSSICQSLFFLIV